MECEISYDSDFDASNPRISLYLALMCHEGFPCKLNRKHEYWKAGGSNLVSFYGACFHHHHHHRKALNLIELTAKKLVVTYYVAAARVVMSYFKTGCHSRPQTIGIEESSCGETNNWNRFLIKVC